MSTTEKATRPITGYPLKLEKAMNITNNWREVVKHVFGNDEEVTPRGFYIPIDDILAIVDNYKDFKIKGIRAYFALKSPLPPYADATKGILVPVIEEEQGAGKIAYKDLIIPARDEAAEDGDVSIYDLTRPCPVFCDKSSPLY